MGEIKTWISAPGSQRLLLYIAFIVHSLFRFTGALGDDLSSSYIACHLLAHGDGGHLYDFHPAMFDVVDTAAWVSVAADAKFAGFLHPYVQTPLWAWALRPLCTALTFGAFSTLFLCMALVSLVIMVEIVARAWAPKFLQPLPLGLLLVAIIVTAPFQYAMWLVQTHALFLMLTVTALYLAQRDHAFKAGALLALACAVKITPGLFLIYWLVGGRHRAASWFVVCSLALAGLTVAAAGTDLTLAYVRSMQRVSDVLLVSYNNQSLAALLAYSASMVSELGDWKIHTLTPVLKITSLGASLVGIAFAGWMSRGADRQGASVALGLIVMTIFSPIAWTHYFVALIPAVMVLACAGGALPWAVVVITFILNVAPVAIEPIGPHVSSVSLIRSHFFASVLLMVALVLQSFGLVRPAKSAS